MKARHAARTMRSALAGLGAAVALAASPAAQALDEAGAKAVVERFIQSQKPVDAEPQAAHHVIADVDADGRPDVVLQWDELGPTWWRSRLTLLLDRGRTYRALTTDVEGQVQGIRVQGSTIVVDTLTLGPKDPRCCPTVKKRLTWRWVDGRLVTAR